MLSFSPVSGFTLLLNRLGLVGESRGGSSPRLRTLGQCVSFCVTFVVVLGRSQPDCMELLEYLKVAGIP